MSPIKATSHTVLQRFVPPGKNLLGLALGTEPWNWSSDTCGERGARGHPAPGLPPPPLTRTSSSSFILWLPCIILNPANPQPRVSSPACRVTSTRPLLPALQLSSATHKTEQGPCRLTVSAVSPTHPGGHSPFGINPRQASCISVPFSLTWEVLPHCLGKIKAVRCDLTISLPAPAIFLPIYLDCFDLGDCFLFKANPPVPSPWDRHHLQARPVARCRPAYPHTQVSCPERPICGLHAQLWLWGSLPCPHSVPPPSPPQVEVLVSVTAGPRARPRLVPSQPLPCADTGSFAPDIAASRLPGPPCSGRSAQSTI